MDVDKSLTLGGLADASQHTAAISTSGYETPQLVQWLRTMLLIRQAEERIGDNVANGTIRCPCHLGIGQEAIAAGVSTYLKAGVDRVFGTHRSHSHYIALGGSVEALFAEVLGKATGCSKGMGGSMHLVDKPNGFWGSVPIVGATIPLAVGAALACKKDGRGGVGVTYFGDGATEEGGFHESLNFAAAFKLPTLFVCENNLFSSHLHINLRQPLDATARFAKANAIPYEIVDGNDVVAVAKATFRLLELARAGQGPVYLEAVTYRWRGHVGPREDIDVGVKRKDDLMQWKRRDPVQRLVEGMLSEGQLTEAQYADIRATVAAEVETAWHKAELAPYPPANATLDYVYAIKEVRP